MSKTARGCARRCRGQQHPAILPWPSNLPSVCPEVLRYTNRQPMAAGRKRRTLRERSHVARARPRQCGSTPDTKPLDQRLVAAFVDPLEIIEQLAARRDELQQPAPRMIVLHMALEMLGEVADALGEDRHLHLGRTGVARL